MSASFYRSFSGAPQRMYRNPEQDTYEIGDFIECFADANPSAEYSWTNLDTLRFYPGDRIDFTEEWVGTWRMQCRAENVINGVPYTNDYFFVLVVNGRRNIILSQHDNGYTDT